jgi:hypothetical protein
MMHMGKGLNFILKCIGEVLKDFKIKERELVIFTLLIVGFDYCKMDWKNFKVETERLISKCQ